MAGVYSKTMDLKEWEKGKKEEVNFWRHWLTVHGKAYEVLNRLSDMFTPMIGAKKKVKIANLGSGPVSLIGDRRRDVEVHVFSSDLLAREYRKLFKELNLNPANPAKRQDMTRLTYKDNSFDIVFCSNALDHCQDPYKAVQEMVRICKPGGWVYIRHIAHEGQRRHYHNLHKWNVDMTEKGDCIFWNNDPNPQTETFLLSEIHPSFTTTLTPIRHGSMVTSILQKNE